MFSVALVLIQILYIIAQATFFLRIHMLNHIYCSYELLVHSQLIIQKCTILRRIDSNPFFTKILNSKSQTIILITPNIGITLLNYTFLLNLLIIWRSLSYTFFTPSPSAFSIILISRTNRKSPPGSTEAA